jgi:HSP20 family protein
MFEFINKRKQRSSFPWESLTQGMNHFFERFSENSRVQESLIFPKVDIRESHHHMEVLAEIPGVAEKDVIVFIRNNKLIIKGEKKLHFKAEKGTYSKSEISTGPFYRRITFTDDIDQDKVTASYKDGILIVNMEKLPESKRKIKKIPIQLNSFTQGHEGARH